MRCCSRGSTIPARATITIGGVNVRDMEQSELRRSVGVVLQEPFLFSRTVAQNIAITRENVSQAEIEQAAKEACLHDVDRAVSKSGYETVVGERGVTLSGGQKAANRHCADAAGTCADHGF